MIAQPIGSRSLIKQVSRALGLENKPVRRIILDIELDDAVLVYVEMFADAEMYKVDFNGREYFLSKVKGEKDSEV